MCWNAQVIYILCYASICSFVDRTGSWSSMVGSADGVQKLGLIPCAISWLYSAIERRREKTWTDLTVSVSAVELCCGEEDTLRDLLGEVAPSLGSIQDSPKAHIRIQEDPIYGIQVDTKVFLFGQTVKETTAASVHVPNLLAYFLTKPNKPQTFFFVQNNRYGNLYCV